MASTAGFLLGWTVVENAPLTAEKIVPAILLSVPFLIGGLVLVAYNLRPWLAGFYAARPQVILSGEPIRVGDGVSVRFRQEFRHPASVRSVRLELVFREWARYSSGKNSHTATHEEALSEYELPGQEMEDGTELAFSQVMQIPREAMHTFEARHNKLTWFLRVTVDIAGWPDYREAFPIRVLPAIGREG
jgi:hypothetical protein